MVSGLFTSGSARPSTAKRPSPLRERARDNAGDGHQAIRVLMMFVDADAVEAQRVGRYEFLDESFVERVTFVAIEIRIRQRDPRTVIEIGSFGSSGVYA